MIILFGPAGAGKSMQGYMLAARFGWRWLSAGQLLRETRDPDLMESMRKGEFVDDDQIRSVMGEAIKSADNVEHLILDGFPRQIQQAEWLLDSEEYFDREIQVVIVLDVSREVIEKRLAIRGRADDTADSIDKRLALFSEETSPILDFFKQSDVIVKHVNGEGTIGQVHDAILSALEEEMVFSAKD